VKYVIVGRRERTVGEVKYEIVKPLISLQSTGKFRKELNLVSWNDREPVYDLRGWKDDHSEMTKGITLSEEEFQELKNKIMEV
jgi:hypothetical protein